MAELLKIDDQIIVLFGTPAASALGLRSSLHDTLLTTAQLISESTVWPPPLHSCSQRENPENLQCLPKDFPFQPLGSLFPWPKGVHLSLLG